LCLNVGPTAQKSLLLVGGAISVAVNATDDDPTPKKMQEEEEEMEFVEVGSSAEAQVELRRENCHQRCYVLSHPRAHLELRDLLVFGKLGVEDEGGATPDMQSSNVLVVRPDCRKELHGRKSSAPVRQ
ncbi:hypothetical protein THAOC_20142, partial [Thalassiosira oceanica]